MPTCRDILRLGAYQLLYLDACRHRPSSTMRSTLTRRGGKSQRRRPRQRRACARLARERESLTWPAVPTTPTLLRRPLRSSTRIREWLVERWLGATACDATERGSRSTTSAPALCLAANRHADASREALADELAARRRRDRTPHRGRRTACTSSAVTPLARAFRGPLPSCRTRLAADRASWRRPARGERVLDLCASPGGKTRRRWRDVGATRARRGLATSGRTACALLARHADALPRRRRARGAGPCRRAAAVRDAAFDRVSGRAPCSGLGTLRRDPDIRWRRSPTICRVSPATQIELLERAAALVRPGGSLVYSTCSSEPEENEDVVAAPSSRRRIADFTPRAADPSQTLPFRRRPRGLLRRRYCVRADRCTYPIVTVVACALRTRVVERTARSCLLAGAPGRHLPASLPAVAMRVAVRAREVTVPDLVGKSLDDATALLGRRLDLQLRDRSTRRRPDTKVAGRPRARPGTGGRSPARRQRSVRVWVERGAHVALAPAWSARRSARRRSGVAQDGLSTAPSPRFAPRCTRPTSSWRRIRRRRRRPRRFACSSTAARTRRPTSCPI